MNETPAAINKTVKPKRSRRFKIGVFFLVVNMPFGYGGGILASVIGIKMGHPVLGVGWGVCIYIISWIMLGLGIWMAGPKGLLKAKHLRKKWLGVKKAPSGPAAPQA